MTQQKNFPEAIKQEGTKEKFFFLSEIIEGKKKLFVPMLTSENGVEEIDNSEVAGMQLPVYIRMWKTFIYAGVLETV